MTFLLLSAGDGLTGKPAPGKEIIIAAGISCLLDQSQTPPAAGEFSLGL
jgi:hypothetical protein